VRSYLRSHGQGRNDGSVNGRLLGWLSCPVYILSTVQLNLNFLHSTVFDAASATWKLLLSRSWFMAALIQYLVYLNITLLLVPEDKLSVYLNSGLFEFKRCVTLKIPSSNRSIGWDLIGFEFYACNSFVLPWWLPPVLVVKLVLSMPFSLLRVSHNDFRVRR